MCDVEGVSGIRNFLLTYTQLVLIVRVILNYLQLHNINLQTAKMEKYRKI